MILSLSFFTCRTSIVHTGSCENLIKTDKKILLVEFNLVILILLIRDALSICSTCKFIVRWFSICTPRNFTDSVTFRSCPYIDNDVSLMTFLWEKLIKWLYSRFKWFCSTYHINFEFGSKLVFCGFCLIYKELVLNINVS